MLNKPINIAAGAYHLLKVQRKTAVGLFLEDGKEGLLLPKRFAPVRAKPGDELKVFVYHDSEDRLIATTQTPLAVVGDIALLTVVSVTKQGAFLDWGLMKDLFVPKTKQLTGMRVGGNYLVQLYVDEQTGRVAATEKFESSLSNSSLTVKEMELVQLTAYRSTEIGWVVIINNIHTGMLHFNEIYRPIAVGDKMEGFIKAIRIGADGDNKIDVAVGKPGYQRVEDEAEKIMRLLKENKGYLPYYDKSSPDDIYSFFGMSKKTFKMTIGSLYKQQKILITSTGIKMV
jgi:uncharacterized protein